MNEFVAYLVEALQGKMKLNALHAKVSEYAPPLQRESRVTVVAGGENQSNLHQITVYQHGDGIQIKPGDTVIMATASLPGDNRFVHVSGGIVGHTYHNEVHMAHMPLQLGRYAKYNLGHPPRIGSFEEHSIPIHGQTLVLQAPNILFSHSEPSQG